MADFTMVVGARDEATRVLKNVRNETDLLERSVVSLQKQTEESVGRFEIVFAGLAGIATGVAAFIAGSKIKEVSDDGIKAFKDQKDAAEKFAETLTLIDGRLKGLKDSEIDLKDTLEQMPAAFKLMEDKGLLAGSAESVERFTAAVEYSKKASEQAWASVGAVFAPFENAVINGYARIADTITAVLNPAIEESESYFESYQSTVDWVLDSIEDSIFSVAAAAKVGFDRFDDVLRLSMLTGAHSVEKFKNDSIFAFHSLHAAVVNPINAIGDQFALVFHRIGTRLTDLVSVSKAVLTDITGVVNGKYDAIFNRDSAEGFDFTPQIDLGAFDGMIRRNEAKMLDAIQKLAASLGVAFADEFSENSSFLDHMKDAIDKDRFEFKLPKPPENKDKDASNRRTGFAENKAEDTRLLARNTTKDPIEDLVAEVKVQKDIAGKQLEAAEEANRILRSKQGEIIVEIVG